MRDLGERGREVDRAEDDHARRQRERLDEDADLFLARFAVLAVVAGRREAGLELAERVARDDAVEIRVAERARSARPSGRTSSLAPMFGPR